MNDCVYGLSRIRDAFFCHCGESGTRVRCVLTPPQAERSLARVEIWQRLVSSMLAASALVNVGTVLR